MTCSFITTQLSTYYSYSNLIFALQCMCMCECVCACISVHRYNGVAQLHTSEHASLPRTVQHSYSSCSLSSAVHSVTHVLILTHARAAFSTNINYATYVVSVINSRGCG